MRQKLLESFRFALEATHPYHLTRQALPQTPPTHVLALGKAAFPMLKAVSDAYGRVPGLGVTRYGHLEPGVHLPGIELLEAGHPVPDEQSLLAGERVLEFVGRLHPSDHLLVLISGGGSALVSAPWGVSSEEKQALSRALLASGADIREVNAVRKHLSRLKGGRLAAATRARVSSLLLSDVPGDDPSVIASGPTVPDPSTFAQALEVLERYGIESPARGHLERGARGELPETPKPGDPLFARVENRLIGAARHLLAAARAYWEGQGYPVLTLCDRFVGEARELARFHAAMVQSIREAGQPVAPPVVLLSGGEAGVTVRGLGKGGRNQEFLLWLAYCLDEGGVWAMACDSDGIDGNTEAAGAVIHPELLHGSRRLEAKERLANNDAYGFFKAHGGLVISGPTQNNLNDYRVIVVE
ncbi:glycerate kinase type-2 family protein [Calidithermus timidus]|jgi:glycerate 2-kinase|uniref:glycerate kinase type-2 family protein n=1 Tax=Calidithermus timidus TaxID=307124 RepID=UPI0003648866|nr:glycerate kinase [Calidithermus timidus]